MLGDFNVQITYQQFEHGLFFLREWIFCNDKTCLMAKNSEKILLQSLRLRLRFYWGRLSAMS